MTDKDLFELAAVFIPESCKTGSWIDGYKAMLNAAPAPDVQPVAWQYKKEGGGIFASDQCPADIEVWNDIEWNKPLYTHPPAADVQELERNEQYQIQMAAISTASLGYWQEGDEISPDYDTVALRDTANLYDRYKAERADALELVEALKDLLYQAKLSEDEGGWDFEQAQAALAKWEGK